MSEKVFDSKNVILLKLNEDDLISFLVDTDLMDDGEYDWRIKDLVDLIIKVLPEYVFADYIGSDVNMFDLVDRLREAAKSLYKIKDYDIMRRAYLFKEQEAIDKVEKGGHKIRGEFGELLLHLLLRDYKNTIPLVSKVYFKDSPGVPAHGFDAVHISPDEEILWLGESKLYANAKGGLKALLKDLDEHFNTDYLDEQFVIIKKNLSNNTIPQRDYWIEQLTKCTKLSDRIKMINIPLLCVFPDNIYNQFIDLGSSQAYVVHEKNIRELKAYFDKHYKHPLKDKLNIILFMFSIKDKDEFISKLHERLWHLQNI